MARKPTRPSAKAPAAPSAAETPTLAAFLTDQPIAPGSTFKVGKGEDGKVTVSVVAPAEPLPSVEATVDRLDAAIEAASKAKVKLRGAMPEVPSVRPGRPTVRPTEFTQELADSLIEHMGEGKSARSWCRGEDHWSFTQMLRHTVNHQEFGAVYARARVAQADVHFDDCLDISDKSDEEESPRRSEVRIKARMEIAAKLNPQRYSNRLDLHVEDKRPATPEARLARITELLALGVPAPAAADAAPTTGV